MKIHHQILCKDLILALKSYFYWYDTFVAEHEWTAQKNANDFEQRLRELLPSAIEMIHDPDFDYHIR